MISDMKVLYCVNIYAGIMTDSMIYDDMGQPYPCIFLSTLAK